MTKVLITGSEGNVGVSLVPYLNERGYTTLRCDIQNYHADNYMMVDVKTPADLALAFHSFEPEIVIHLGAVVSRITSEKAPHLTIDTNVSGTNNLIHLCKTYGAKLVYFSTSEVYGNVGGLLSENLQPCPNNRYGLSKYLGEILVNYEVKNYGLDALTIRPFMLYDENETRGVHRSAMVRFTESLLDGKKIVVHKGAKRSWLYITDAVRIIERLLHVDGFYTVNMGNPNLISMLDLAKLICDKTGASYDLITEAKLPPRMTLQKLPDLTLQRSFTGVAEFFGLDEGVSRLVSRLRREMLQKSQL